MNRVIITIRQFHKLGGLEKYSLYTANALAGRGYEVIVLTTGEPPEAPLNKNIKIHYFKLGRGPNFRRIKRFDINCQNWIKNNYSPIILGMDITAFQTHIRAGNGSHAAFLERRSSSESFFKKISFKINPKHRKILQLEKRAFEHPSLKKLITNSNMVKNEILDRYNIKPEKLVTIHNGVEFDKMEKDFNSWKTEKQSILKKFTLPETAYHFLFIGIGFKRKGLEPLLRGLALLKEKDITLSILGDDKNVNYYIRLAEELKISEKVRFFGKRKDIRQFLKFADSIVIPSFYDPFANVTLEALAMGVFVVTSKYNGGKEVLTPNSGTVIEELLNPISVKKALETALEQPKTPDNAASIRQSVSHLTFNNQLNKLIDCITDNE